DTKAEAGTPRPLKEKKTVAAMQYELLRENPYRYTSDDILFQVYADREKVEKGDYSEARKAFFSKGQPCFRASPLTKSYGLEFTAIVTVKLRFMEWKQKNTKILWRIQTSKR